MKQKVDYTGKIFQLVWGLILLLTITACSTRQQSGEQAVPAQETRVDPLPSWNETAAKQRIVEFVRMVTDRNSPDYVPPEERIATFDNDGTLWSEQPAYFQLLFAMDRIREMAPHHPEWQQNPLIQAVLHRDLQTVAQQGLPGILKILALTHAGMSTTEFQQVVLEWFRQARHPITGKPYAQMVFQPMLELIDYLRAHHFRVYIVSGGGIDFMRAFTEEIYGIPPEQVIGSRGKLQYQLKNGIPVLLKLPEMDFVNDNVNKPVAIHQIIGRRPILAFGNSDGDLQMLQWTWAGPGKRLCAYIHHTDASREWAYDRNSSIGKLDKGLDEAAAKGWLVVDMKTDWKVIFPSGE